MFDNRTRVKKTIAVGASAAVAAGSLMVAAPSAQAAPPKISTSNSPQVGAGWLGAQDIGVGGSPLTSSIIALTSAKVGKKKSRQWIEVLRKNVGTYIAPGPAMPGSLGKTIYTVQIQGQNAASFGGYNMSQLLRDLMLTSGANKGRFQYSANDFSSGLIQAWGILGLAQTPGGAPKDAIDYMIKLQCPNGGFAAAYQPYDGSACTDNADADHDTTSYAIQALLSPGVAKVVPGATAAAKKGAQYLVKDQGANGAWDAPPWSPDNSNSTGLGAQAVRAAGYTAAADKGSRWIQKLQINCTNASSGPAAKDRGAIAYISDQLQQALSSGIASNQLASWMMAVQQNITGMTGSAPLNVTTHKNQADGLPRATCAPLKAKVTKVAKYKNGKARVYFTGPKATTLSWKASGYKYRVRYAGKKWGKSWKSAKASAKYISLPKAKVRNRKRGEVSSKYRWVTRYVQIRAVNKGGTSVAVEKKVRQLVRI